MYFCSVSFNTHNNYFSLNGIKWLSYYWRRCFVRQQPKYYKERQWLRQLIFDLSLRKPGFGPRSVHEIYGGQSGIELVYFPCTSVFSCQHHSTNTPYWSPARRTNRPSVGTFTKKLTRKTLSGSFHVFKRSYLSTVDFSYCLQKTPATKHRRHLCLSHISSLGKRDAWNIYLAMFIFRCHLVKNTSHVLDAKRNTKDTGSSLEFQVVSGTRLLFIRNRLLSFRIRNTMHGLKLGPHSKKL